MPSKKFRLRIITPERVKLDEDVDMVIMRCMDGDLGILADHEPLSAALSYGVMRIIDEDAERRIAIYGGIAEVRDNVITILTPDAEWPEDIDRAAAEADCEQARKLLSEENDSPELQRYQEQLRRALLRLEVSSSLLAKK